MILLNLQIILPKNRIEVELTIIKEQKIISKYLKHEVIYDLILPTNEDTNKIPRKVLYMNDGQDLEKLDLITTLNDLNKEKTISLPIVVAIRAKDRLREYGTASVIDYKKRGDKSKQYQDFVLNELMPEIQNNYQASVKSDDNYFCGFSLGALSAMDIVWGHPEKFSKVGAFSGSFWWRKKAYEDGYDDYNDRIMHVLVRNRVYDANQQFWFQCGTNDETDDRNNNGIIDSIDDTLDLIAELKQKGYQADKQIKYVEIEGGEHNYKTWSKAMKLFLVWLLAKK